MLTRRLLGLHPYKIGSNERAESSKQRSINMAIDNRIDAFKKAYPQAAPNNVAEAALAAVKLLLPESLAELIDSVRKGKRKAQEYGMQKSVHPGNAVPRTGRDLFLQ